MTHHRKTKIAGYPSMVCAPTDTLAPLSGAVVSQYVRCGKSGCHCQGGEKHGPYHYRVWRDGDKIHKDYINPADLERVQAQCDLHSEYAKRLCAARARLDRLVKGIAREARKAQALIRGS